MQIALLYGLYHTDCIVQIALWLSHYDYCILIITSWLLQCDYLIITITLWLLHCDHYIVTIVLWPLHHNHGIVTINCIMTIVLWLLYCDHRTYIIMYISWLKLYNADFHYANSIVRVLLYKFILYSFCCIGFAIGIMLGWLHYENCVVEIVL